MGEEPRLNIVARSMNISKSVVILGSRIVGLGVKEGFNSLIESKIGAWCNTECRGNTVV